MAACADFHGANPPTVHISGSQWLHTNQLHPPEKVTTGSPGGLSAPALPVHPLQSWAGMGLRPWVYRGNGERGFV